MMSGKEKLYFLLNAIEDARTIAPSGQPLMIDPANDLNLNYRGIELDQLFTKLEKDEKVLKVLKASKRVNSTLGELDPDPYEHADDGCWHIELLPAFDGYFLKIQQEPEYQEFTGKKPPLKDVVQLDTPQIESLYKKIADVDEQIRIRREALAKAQSSINENPFYSEATRVGHLAKLEQQAQTDIGNFLKQKETYLMELRERKGSGVISQDKFKGIKRNIRYNQLVEELRKPNQSPSELKERYDKAIKDIISKQSGNNKFQDNKAKTSNCSFNLIDNVLSINGKRIEFRKDTRKLALLKLLVKKQKGIYYSEVAEKLEGAVTDETKNTKNICYEACRGLENSLAKIGITDFLQFDYNQAKINPLYKRAS